MTHRLRTGILAGLAAGTLLAAAPGARAQSAGGYGDYVAWEDWARIVPGERAGLASSWDRTGGHYDANQYESPPGLILDDRDVVAATLTGPGILERFWMPHFAAGQPFALRMYFDGETVPRLDTDSGQLLGGHLAPFSDPLLTTFAGGQVCYEPIPFRESVRIETENRANLWHWYQYSYRKLPAGADVASWDGSLDPDAEAARAAAATMFENVGTHPAGESATAVTISLGATVVPPDAAVAVASFAAGGVLRRITVSMPGATDAELDSLQLRVRYDGETTPAIDVPVSRFFGAGHGRAPYRSLPLGTDSPAGFYCFWPMPFRASVDVELFNASSSAIAILSAAVENEPGPPSPGAGYLHAETRSELRGSQAWMTLASVQGTGHYVGNLLYVDHPDNSYQFLEGDDLVVVDHADSLHGTGLEDAYNGGFYYNWVNPQIEPEGPSPSSAIRPLHGLLHLDRGPTPPHARADQYRWMIADRVPFSESLVVAVEAQYYSVGSTRWTSVVFWYQLPEAATHVSEAGASAFGAGALARLPGEGRANELTLAGPNPFRTSIALSLSLVATGAADVDIAVVDPAGRVVRDLYRGPITPGRYRVVWDGRDQAEHPAVSGVYFVRASSGEWSQTSKVVKLR